MPPRTIKFEGKTYQFPDDATEQEIGEALASVHDQGPPANVTNDPHMENPLTDAHISPPESGVGGFLNRQLASVKTALGGNKPERGSGSAAVDLVGGPAIGPLHVAHGVTQMPRHPVQGFNEAVGGVAQTAALPLAVAAPAAIPMSMPYVVGAKAGAWGLTEAGMDPDNAEALSNLVTMGVAGRGSLVRGTGKVLEKVGGASDIPELPFPSRTGAAARIFNAVKRPIGQAGRKMSNYGVPQAPNVYNGDASGPLPGEPDLPTPVKPDGMDHHNDVTDHGELDKLLDQVSQQPEVRQGRDPVQADRMPHHDDQSHIDMTPPREPNVQPQSPSEDIEGMAQRQGIDLGQTTPVKGANELAEDPTANIPTPNSDTLLRAIKSAPGWPENGLSNEPWDSIHIKDAKPEIIPPDKYEPEFDNIAQELHGQKFSELPEIFQDQVHDEYNNRMMSSSPSDIDAGDELSHALDTDPYNRPPDQQVQSPIYSGAERRGFSRSVGNPDKLLEDLSRGGKESALTDKLSSLSDQWSKLGVDPDSFLRPARPGFMEDAQDWMNTFGKDTDRSNFSSWVGQGKPGVRPLQRSTDTSGDTVGSTQGAAEDTNDFAQAKSSLGPDATVSQIALEAQRLKLKRTGGK